LFLFLSRQIGKAAPYLFKDVKSNLTIGALDDWRIGEYANAGADIAVIAEN
jgi:hypothetical protein